jgi:hypothetical protein
MRNLLDTSKCPKFLPTFTDQECQYYVYATDSQMNILPGICGKCKLPNAYKCVADITRIIPLSHSSIGDFSICHYLYMLKKIMGIEVRPQFLSTPMKAGILWDGVLQKHLGGNILLRGTRDNNGVKEIGIIDKYEIDDITIQKVRAIFNAYKELEMVVDPGFELQKKIDIALKINIPAVSFMAPISNTDENAINLWLSRDAQIGDNRGWLFDLMVTGFYDRKYNNYFVENKLSGRPEFYLDPFYIQSQNGTYFLADKNLEYCIQEVVQFPKQKEYTKRDESPEQLYKRVFDDVLSHPSKYFIGFDREKRVYGKKFYRGEFDLDEIKNGYKQTILEILSCRWTGNWPKRWKSCNNVLPGISCDFQSICKTGNVSETMFQIREN